MFGGITTGMFWMFCHDSSGLREGNKLMHACASTVKNRSIVLYEVFRMYSVNETQTFCILTEVLLRIL